MRACWLIYNLDSMGSEKLRGTSIHQHNMCSFLFRDYSLVKHKPTKDMKPVSPTDSVCHYAPS